jgi:hypothetical protein
MIKTPSTINPAMAKRTSTTHKARRFKNATILLPPAVRRFAPIFTEGDVLRAGAALRGAPAGRGLRGLVGLSIIRVS